ncbi:MAG: hypothetical protein JSU95_12365 [Betaproteobacteria bacterium]|nr:MAG: hypothetical protein JSU95_12365 [Betaproteobacteria bacterium]
MVRTLVGLLIWLAIGPVSAMDLMDLYQEAKANDARYAAARAQFRAMQELVPQAGAGVAPESYSDGTYWRYRYHKGGSPAFSSGRSHRYRGELVRPAYR